MELKELNKSLEAEKPDGQPKSGFDRNPELIRRHRAGDRAAGEELIRLNSPLVYSIVGRFSGRNADTADLVECGIMGLVKAINTFDLERGFAFSTYAVPLIFGEIRRFLRDDGPIKVSREEKRLCLLLNRERERRIADGEPCDLSSLARAVGISVQDAASALYSEAPVKSLDEAMSAEEDAPTLGSTVADSEDEHRVFEKIALRFAIDKLSDLHRRLVILRYFRDYSQTETARIMGISQVKVSREEKKIIEQLRREMS